jgi:hypothetical protein
MTDHDPHPTERTYMSGTQVTLQTRTTTHTQRILVVLHAGLNGDASSDAAPIKHIHARYAIHTRTHTGQVTVQTRTHKFMWHPPSEGTSMHNTLFTRGHTQGKLRYKRGHTSLCGTHQARAHPSTIRYLNEDTHRASYDTNEDTQVYVAPTKRGHTHVHSTIQTSTYFSFSGLGLFYTLSSNPQGSGRHTCCVLRVELSAQVYVLGMVGVSGVLGCTPGSSWGGGLDI